MRKKRRPPMVWDGTPGKRFVSFVREGKSISEIMEYFPQCSFRQIEYHLEKVCKKHKLPKPKKLGRRKVRELRLSQAIKEVRRHRIATEAQIEQFRQECKVWDWDFTPDNIRVDYFDQPVERI